MGLKLYAGLGPNAGFRLSSVGLLREDESLLAFSVSVFSFRVSIKDLKTKGVDAGVLRENTYLVHFVSITLRLCLIDVSLPHKDMVLGQLHLDSRLIQREAD